MGLKNLGGARSCQYPRVCQQPDHVKQGGPLNDSGQSCVCVCACGRRREKPWHGHVASRQGKESNEWLQQDLQDDSYRQAKKVIGILRQKNRKKTYIWGGTDKQHQRVVSVCPHLFSFFLTCSLHQQAHFSEYVCNVKTKHDIW